MSKTTSLTAPSTGDSRVSYRTCPLCEATCGLAVEAEGERVVRVRGDRGGRLQPRLRVPQGHPDRRSPPRPGPAAPLRSCKPRRRPARRGELGGGLRGRGRARLRPDRRASTGAGRFAAYVGNPNAHNVASDLLPRPVPEVARYAEPVLREHARPDAEARLERADVRSARSPSRSPDVDHTDHLLMLGANPVESNGSLAHRAGSGPGRLRKRHGASGVPGSWSSIRAFTRTARAGERARADPAGRRRAGCSRR